ncbi:hypothetical protein J7D62_000678 [Campylobacter lari]|uniref:HNH endonuclease n=1 Tax=Campylobacter lari (strain RM2100 / D67 / ATCC BAA-1060) TaxID=306263 RepID=B9KCB3_CAMLR|nr:hypothetical protein [Campylobacter lari]ACM64202.1 hypothetical protein CLA_0876 [Campylobacter lari RM2100]EAH6262119.1 hypothetical protein [Campylobacter lari]EAH7188425.1 hypothetical protein [Campylobacter lari]EAI4303234.1 hypothetical protein [Campylobacter lari]EAI4827072.1 hypothetical protein [Campylobacter lari]
MENQTLEEKFEELYLKSALSEWDKAINELKNFDKKEVKSELKKKHKLLKDYIVFKLNERYGEFDNEKYDKLYQKMQEIENDCNLRSKYNSLKNRNNIKEPFNGIDNFISWYKKQEKECYYCKIAQSDLANLFKNKLITSKKPSFNSSLQIERLNPDKGYNEENCVLACCICNNAKSDMISASDFEKYFSNSVKNFYENLLKNIKPK